MKTEKILEFLARFLGERGSLNDIRFSEITSGGSDRKFYRIILGAEQYILLESGEDPQGFKNFLEINRILQDIGIGVPRILLKDIHLKLLLMEDLGFLSLYKLLNETNPSGDITAIYQKAIDELLRMQIEGEKQLERNSLLRNTTFDYGDYRWESWYFTAYFVNLYSSVRCPIGSELAREYHQLARTLDCEPRYFMHRDFQSQNILIKDGQIRVIDYQGACRGCLAYDLASLIRDPYYILSKEQQKDLLDYYIDKANSGYRLKLEPGKFRRIFNYASVQRGMQALGAFAYLFRIKGKPRFEQYIKGGIIQLSRSLDQVEGLNKLKGLINQFKDS
ncbi:phosphotransferase [bacterium]|nr:phosphotransferase [bacterium]